MREYREKQRKRLRKYTHKLMREEATGGNAGERNYR